MTLAYTQCSNQAGDLYMSLVTRSILDFVSYNVFAILMSCFFFQATYYESTVCFLDVSIHCHWHTICICLSFQILFTVDERKRACRSLNTCCRYTACLSLAGKQIVWWTEWWQPASSWQEFVSRCLIIILYMLQCPFSHELEITSEKFSMQQYAYTIVVVSTIEHDISSSTS